MHVSDSVGLNFHKVLLLCSVRERKQMRAAKIDCKHILTFAMWAKRLVARSQDSERCHFD